jgi:hypothetical protein
LTALGHIRLRRQYIAAADDQRFPADAVLGVEGYVTAAAQRMAVLAGARDSFARAEAMLRELAGWELDDEVIRQLTHGAAKSLIAAREHRTDTRRFAQAEGAVEVQIDAGKGNTTTDGGTSSCAWSASGSGGNPRPPSGGATACCQPRRFAPWWPHVKESSLSRPTTASGIWSPTPNAGDREREMRAVAEGVHDPQDNALKPSPEGEGFYPPSRRQCFRPP